MSTLPPLVQDLADWIGQPIPSDAEARAAAVLSAAANLVVGYAGKTADWIADVEVPADVSDIVVQVAARVYLSPPNPNVRNWTKGPFAEGYFDAAGNGLYLTDEEKVTLDRFRSSASGLGVLSTTREDPTTGTIYVPTGPPPAGYDFPWYAADGY